MPTQAIDPPYDHHNLRRHLLPHLVKRNGYLFEPRHRQVNRPARIPLVQHAMNATLRIPEPTLPPTFLAQRNRGKRRIVVTVPVLPLLAEIAKNGRCLQPDKPGWRLNRAERLWRRVTEQLPVMDLRRRFSHYYHPTKVALRPPLAAALADSV